MASPSTQAAFEPPQSIIFQSFIPAPPPPPALEPSEAAIAPERSASNRQLQEKHQHLEQTYRLERRLFF